MSGTIVTVHGIGVGGVGVGRLGDGKVVFLARTAPGDRVKIRILQEKARWARGEVVEWLQLGPGRRTPPCERFVECDGCSIQHLDYDQQVAWKGRLVGEALRRVGRIDSPDPFVTPSPEELRYRNRVTFTLRRLDGGRVVAGFRELRRPGRVVDIGSECLLPERILADTWEKIRVSWGPGADLLPAGRELRLTLRRVGEQVGLTIRGGRGIGSPESLLAAVPTLGSIWKEEKGSEIRLLAGERALEVQTGGESVRLEGTGFLQVNEGACCLLYDYVLSRVDDPSGRKIIDAYCGVGVLGRSLARAGAEVIGIESNRFLGNDPSPQDEQRFQILTGLVEDELASLLPADLVILNPPRSGLSASVPETLVSIGPPEVVYVSCDPATLARDLDRMSEAYEVEDVRAFDLFPQTGHVETVVSLRAAENPIGVRGGTRPR
jgi:23S rRNA (uracil1939-C5)-methyltransferase